jgi:hypothetical protein
LFEKAGKGEDQLVLFHGTRSWAYAAARVLFSKELTDLLGVIDDALGEEAAREIEAIVFVLDRTRGDGMRQRDLCAIGGLGTLTHDMDVEDTGLFCGVQDSR